MIETHDWHVLDDERDVHVRRTADGWEVRDTDGVRRMSDTEFDAFRAGPIRGDD